MLHTNFLRGWGGQSNRILNECEGAAARGFEILLAVPPKSELAKRGGAAGLAVHDQISFRGGLRFSLFRDVVRMRRLLRNFRPHILHLHGGRDTWIAAIALFGSRKSARPIVIRTKHNEFAISDHVINRYLYGRFFDAIVCISRAILSQVEAKRYVRGKRLFLIPSACDANRFQQAGEARERMRREFRIGRDEIAVAMTGRLRPEKGHDVLLRSIPQIVRDAPQCKFLLIGSGSRHGELSRRLEEGNLAQNVILTGFRDDVPECLSAADIYVQPSLSEGLGTSVLEASAAGLSIIASDTGGIPDIVESGATGVLVPVGDNQALAREVVRLANDAATRRRFGLAAAEKVSREYSLEALTEKTVAAYSELLKTK